MVDEEFDYYQALKDENYKTLLEKEIQLDSARSRALKQSNASLAAQGLASTGYGQQQRLGIEGQYLQGLQSAQQDFQTQNREIGKQEFEFNQNQQDRLEQKQGSYFNDLLSVLSSEEAVYDEDSLNTALSSQGLLREDNTLDYDKAVELYGQHYADILRTSIELKRNQFTRTAEEERKANSAQTVDDLKNMTFILNGDYTGDKKHVKGQSGTLGDWYGQESEVLMTKAQNGQLEENSVIKVTNGRNDVIYLKWNGVGFEQVNESEYNNANSKHNLQHYNGKNYWDDNTFNDQVQVFSSMKDIPDGLLDAFVEQYSQGDINRWAAGKETDKTYSVEYKGYVYTFGWKDGKEYITAKKKK